MMRRALAVILEGPTPDDLAASFSPNASKGLTLDKSAHIVRLSGVFDWFEADYTPHGSVLKSIAPDIDDAFQGFEADPFPSVGFMNFNWSHNDLPLKNL